MPRPLTLAAAAILVAAALAGCTREDAPLQEQAIAPGWLTGVVTDAAFLPIENANVSVEGANASALADITGTFRLEVLPGEYVVLASAPEHRNGALRASVRSGETATLAFTLDAIPRIVPYREVHEAQGYLACGVIVLQGSSEERIPCGDNDPNARESVEFGLASLDGLEAIVLELVWTPGSDAARVLRVSVEGRAGETFATLGAGEGASPLKLALSGRLVSAETLVITASPGGAFTDEEAGVDAGAVLQQEFTTYATLFYHDGAPAGYSALDAP